MLKKYLLMTLMIFCIATNANAQTAEEYQSQISACTEEINIDKKNASLYIKRADIYVKLYEIDSENKENKKALQNARKDYTKAIHLDKKSAEAYFKRGMIYNLSKEIETRGEAYDDFSKVIKLSPNNADYEAAYVGRAKVCYAEYVDANFDAMINHDRVLTDSLLKLLHDSVDDLTKAIEFNPNNWEYYYNRGKLHYALNDYQSTAKDYSNAIELNPNELIIYLDRAKTFEKLQQYNEALADYNKILQADYRVAFIETEAQAGRERISKLI